MAEPSNRGDKGDRRRAQRESGATAAGAVGSNAHPPYKTIMITALISGVLGAFLGQFIPPVFGLFRGDIKNQVVTEINQTLNSITRDIGELKTQIAVLKNSIENLEKFGAVGRFKTQATKLGIKNPQIASVDLKPQATFTALFTLRDQPGSFVQMDYDIE